MGFSLLETERLVVRPKAPEDADAFHVGCMAMRK